MNSEAWEEKEEDTEEVDADARTIPHELTRR